MWALGAVGALILSLWEGGRAALAQAMGTEPDTAVLTLGIVFLVVVALDISTKVSRIANQNKNLAQGLARLEKRLGDLEDDTHGD